MSFSIKRTLNDSTNDNKRLKNDSAIDLNYDTEQLKRTKKNPSLYSTSISSESFIEDDSMFDDDDVFEDEQNLMTSVSKSTSQNQGRKRLNGTSTYRKKGNKNKHIKKDNILIDQTLNQLREEQARIDAHSLSLNVK